MKTWMLPWLFSVGLLGAVVFVALAARYAPMIVVAVGLLLAPVLWRVHFPADTDAETSYWRMKRP